MRQELDLDAAIRLIDTYFPGWRTPFLGVREPGPWLTVDEFFRPFSRNQLFSHQWALVGRQADLHEIRSFVSSEARLGLLIGRGGIGKTRLLREFATTIVDAEIRFLATSAEVRSEHLGLLPDTEHLIIILDDAHERSDIADLVAGIGRTRPGAKILLALRPYGMPQLSQQLRRVGLHQSDTPQWELGDLKPSEARQLAKQILGPNWDQWLLDRLAALTADCPLITVVGAQLIRRGRLDPSRLEGDESVRTEILRAFREALVSDSSGGDPAVRRDVLAAVAILQPVRMGNAAFQSALERLTKLRFDRVMHHLRGLEDAGVLIRRGQSLRIIPDLLGDVILSEACYDIRSGVSTGYLERARKMAEGEPLQHVFVNTTRVDWQIRQERAHNDSLVTALWNGVESEFRSASAQGRLEITRLLKKVAFFQPDRAFAIVRWAIDNPSNELEEADEPLARLYAPSHRDVLDQLPPVLRNIAYNFDHLPEAVNLLWRLAQRDPRPTNQHPEHALRILQELAAFENGKPIAYNQAVVDAARKWFEDLETSEWLYSPFDVLEPVLATEGLDHQAEDALTISFKPFSINSEAVRDVRDQVIDLALREARSSDPKRVVRAVTAIGHALRYPMGLMGRGVEDSERVAWTPIFLDTIWKLGEVVADESRDPVVGVAIRQALSWHAKHSPTETKLAAQETLDKLPTSIAHEAALLLHDGWGYLLFDDIDDFGAAEQMKHERFEKLARQIDDEPPRVFRRRF